VVALKWPHSTLGDPTEAVAGWLDELAPFDRDQAEAAVRRLAGREFAPTVGLVAQEIRRAAQGPAPSFDELQQWLSRHASAAAVRADEHADRHVGRARAARRRRRA
jgi:hypothetical protein